MFVSWLGVTLLLFVGLLMLNRLLIEKDCHMYSNANPLLHFLSIALPSFLNGFLFLTPIGANAEFFFSIGLTIIIFAIFSFGTANFIAMAALMLVWTVTSSPLFHATDIANRFKPEEIDTPLFYNQETSKMRIIPLDVAAEMGNKELNVRMTDGSQLGALYSIDKSLATLQKFRGEYTWVFPLEFNSMLKWNSVKTIPGYITVSAEQTNKQELVTHVNGQPLAIKYNTYFSERLMRKFRHEHPSVIISSIRFFLKEDGTPTFVLFKDKPQVGFGSYVPDGLYTFDAQTGDIEYFAAGEEPEYIDYTASTSTLLSMVDDWGEFREGYLESWQSSIRVKATSVKDEVSTQDLFLIDAKGMSNDLAFFTGLTNASGHDALAGMLFYDARTNQPYIHYSQSSAPDETAVIKSVNDALGIEAEKWHPKQPIPYRIYNTLDVWVTPIVSKNNRLVGFGATKVNEISASVWDKTLEGALSKILSSSGQSGDVSNVKLSEAVEGFLRSYRQVSPHKAMITLTDIPILIECDTLKNDNCTAMIEGDWVELKILMKTDNRAFLSEYVNSPVK